MDFFVFKFEAKNGRIDDLATNMENPTREQVKHIKDARRSVEVYHVEIKQTFGIQRCQSHTQRAQRNHIFMAIAAWFEQHKLRIKHQTTLYQQNWNVIKEAIQEQIKILMLQDA